MSVIIDGTTFDIPVISLIRKADVLDKYAERCEDGILHREIIGVYFNYQLSFGSTTDTAEYAALWDKLTEAEEFHTVTVPDESGDYTFTAYFASVGDELRKTKSAANFWKSLTVHFIAQSPARTP
jgi:predicted ATP-grasp superfamily ATP-dependent carboligase